MYLMDMNKISTGKFEGNTLYKVSKNNTIIMIWKMQIQTKTISQVEKKNTDIYWFLIFHIIKLMKLTDEFKI